MSLPPRENDRRIRVLINGLHAKSGGGIAYLRGLMPYLADDPRLELHLFLHADQRDRLLPLDERVRLHVLDFKPGLWTLLLWEQVSLPVAARRISADVTFSPANFGPLFAPRPVILLCNALAVARTEWRPVKRAYWAGLGAVTMISLLRATRAIAVSEYAKRALTFGLRGNIAHKVAVIHHGVDRRFSPGPGEEKGSPYLLAVGDIYVQKNLLMLIRAFTKVRAAHPRIRLKIAGQPIDRVYHARVRELVETLAVGDAVEFLGEQSIERLVSLYHGCAAFVFPSTAESFGMPLAEAMACGAPVACSNTTAMPEIAGGAAQVFDPLNPEDMAAAILAILNDPAYADRLRALGRARSASFSWSSAARMTADVLVAAAGRGCAVPTNTGQRTAPAGPGRAGDETENTGHGRGGGL